MYFIHGPPVFSILEPDRAAASGAAADESLLDRLAAARRAAQWNRAAHGADAPAGCRRPAAMPVKLAMCIMGLMGGSGSGASSGSDGSCCRGARGPAGWLRMQ